MFKISVFVFMILSMVVTGCDDDSNDVIDSAADMSTVTIEDLSMMPQDMAVSEEPVDQEPPMTIIPSDDYRVVPCADYVGKEVEDLECALLTMSQNRIRETDLALELFVVRPQTPPQVNALPVVVLAGGPGSSHASFAARKALPITMSRLLNREVIYYEQRGIPPSAPSTLCPELDSAFNESIAFAGCRTELESLGIDIHSFNTLENAADIADIPAILGYEQIDLIAGSYGTRLVAQVLSRHPGTIRAAVLGGVDVPNTNDAFPGSPVFLNTFERAATLYGEWCAADDICALINPDFDYPTIISQIEALIERDGAVEIFGQPITNVNALAGFAFQMMYIAQIRNLFFGMLYHVANESFPNYLIHVGEGDAEAGAMFLFQLITSAQEAVFGGSSVMSYVTMCYDGDEEYCSVIGDQMNDYPAQDYLQISGSDHPVLFLSGELDPSTPIVNMEQITPLFPNHTHSIFSCLGHDLSRISNLANGECAIDQVRTFLDDPTAELPDCASTLCDQLPLAPTQSELRILLGDYVEDFDGASE